MKTLQKLSLYFFNFSVESRRGIYLFIYFQQQKAVLRATGLKRLHILPSSFFFFLFHSPFPLFCNLFHKKNDPHHFQAWIVMPIKAVLMVAVFNVSFTNSILYLPWKILPFVVLMLEEWPIVMMTKLHSSGIAETWTYPLLNRMFGERKKKKKIIFNLKI